MRIDILSLFPEYFKGPFDCSIIKRAKDEKLIDINLVDIRDFSNDKHKKVDDRPYGGGAGMVLMVKPILKAIKSVKKKGSRVVFLSSQGKRFDNKKAKELSSNDHLILLCGHYEGIDERVLDIVDEEISIGDFILPSGSGVAILLVEAVSRFLPGVLGNSESLEQESFSDSLLQGPCYTKPYEFEGKKVPDILLSGNHKEIEKYKKTKALEKTKKIRPDLYKSYKKNKERCCERSIS